MFVSLRIKKALQWDMWVWRHINRRRTRSCSADDFVKTQRNDSRTQSSKMEPRKWELMCAHPFGDYPKPFCHLVAWDTCYPKSKKKKKGRLGTGLGLWANLSLLYSQEALGKLRTTFQGTFHMESGFSYVSQRTQSWLFLECTGEHNRRLLIVRKYPQKSDA